MLFPGGASTVREVSALSDLDKSVRIADIAARLAILGDLPQRQVFVAGVARSDGLKKLRHRAQYLKRSKPSHNAFQIRIVQLKPSQTAPHLVREAAISTVLSIALKRE